MPIPCMMTPRHLSWYCTMVEPRGVVKLHRMDPQVLLLQYILNMNPCESQQENKAVSTATTPVVKPATGKINEYQGPKSKLNPKDFEFIGLRNEVRVKPPG